MENCPDRGAAITNCLYVNPEDELAYCGSVEASGFIYKVALHPQVAPGTIAVNSVQRKNLRVAAKEDLELVIWRPRQPTPSIGMMYAEVSSIKDKGRPGDINADMLIEHLLRSFEGQTFTLGQEVAFDLAGHGNLKLTVTNLSVDVNGSSLEVQRGVLANNTAFLFTNSGSNPIKISGQKGFSNTQLFKTKKMNFEQLGIGGLDKQFEAIFRRAFASRVFPPSIIQKLGIKHVKGMLLFGPPGTGKTLIARQIGKMLNGKEAKVVNGPEVLNKYVGQSEENIRNLFAEADEEYKAKGDESDLHVIIFDEIDAICKQRGSVSSGTGVHDTVVNQLLTKIDGVDALNNILLIGMTNRRDMLDEALLRPGRLEVQIEIGLPDQYGRHQILKIHTNKMLQNSFLARDVALERLAELTKNFSGAEIEGLVKDAVAYALNRQVDFEDLHKPLDEENIKVTMSDFEHALEEVKPAFGAATEALQLYRVHGMISCGGAFDLIMNTMRTLVKQVQSSDKTPLLTCLLEGPAGSGKSAMAATTAIESEFPFIKVITPENYVGYTEQRKCDQITRVFEDSYRSPLSVIILDDLERLLEYVAIGPRFSNAVLQTLLVLVKRQPPVGKKLLIIGTSSTGEIMESMGLGEVFNISLHVPALRVEEIVRVLHALEIFQESDIPVAVDALTTQCSRTVPMKKLLLWLEMAKQELKPGQKIPLQRWQETLRDLAS